MKSRKPEEICATDGLETCPWDLVSQVPRLLLAHFGVCNQGETLVVDEDCGQLAKRATKRMMESTSLSRPNREGELNFRENRILECARFGRRNLTLPRKEESII